MHMFQNKIKVSPTLLFKSLTEHLQIFQKICFHCNDKRITLHKNWSFPLRILPVNVTKSPANCGLVTFTGDILNGKLNFLCSVSDNNRNNERSIRCCKMNCAKNRNSHRRCSVKKDVLRNFAKFTGKYLCQSLFLNKVAGLRPVTLLKKRLWQRCFLVWISRNF